MKRINRNHRIYKFVGDNSLLGTISINDFPYNTLVDVTIFNAEPIGRLFSALRNREGNTVVVLEEYIDGYKLIAKKPWHYDNELCHQINREIIEYNNSLVDSVDKKFKIHRMVAFELEDLHNLPDQIYFNLGYFIADKIGEEYKK